MLIQKPVRHDSIIASQRLVVEFCNTIGHEQTSPSREGHCRYSSPLDPRLLDNRPPLLDFGLLEGTQRVRGLLLARHHPEDILAGVLEKERRILTILEEMRDLVTAEGE